MDCSCININSYDCGDCAVIHSEQMRVAVKQHICSECGKEINKGEKYEYVSQFYRDGGWLKHKTCSDCLSLRNEFFCDGYYYGEIRDELQQFIRDCHGELSETKISNLTPAAMEWVCWNIEECW